jgi:DNA-binding transcriptional MerR regulator/predicted RNase H-like HicB family nuclease
MRTGPKKTERQGFGVAAVLRLTGVSYRNLDYWARTGLVRASIRAAGGKGSRRVYAFQDLVALRLVKQLRGAGIPLQAIRRAVKYLQAHADAPLSRLALVADGRRVLARTDDPRRMVEATAAGQVVISVDVSPIRTSLQASVAELSSERELLLTVQGRRYRVVLTPDLEVGGFAIHVPELPGCFSEADTVSEGRVMAREAIVLWLDAARHLAAKSRSRAS